MYFARRFVDGSTEICFGSGDGDQFGAKLRFSEEHILHIARQSFTLRRVRLANRALIFFFLLPIVLQILLYFALFL